MSLAPDPTGLFAKISAGSGKYTPHGSAIRAARRLGQSWESARNRSGMGMSGPCSCIRRLTLALPWRGQKLQAMWMVAQVLGDFAEQDGAAGGHLVPGLPPAQNRRTCVV